MNRQITSANKFHDVLYGFWPGRGTRTAALETKLLQQLTAMRDAAFFKGFLDL